MIFSMWMVMVLSGGGIAAENGYSTYFGDLHAHSAWSGDALTSELYESSYDLDHICDYEDGHHWFGCLDSDLTRLLALYNTYHYGMEYAKLDFIAITDHLEYGNPTQVHKYKEVHGYFDFLQRAGEDIQAYCNDNDIDFVPFMGCEWTNHTSEGDTLNDIGQGHRNIIFKNLENLTPFLACNSDEDDYDTMWEIWEAIYNSPLCYDSDDDSVIDATDVILVAHHLAKEILAWVDWNTIYPGKEAYYELLEPIMEIYSGHGNSELANPGFDPYSYSQHVTTSTAQSCLDSGLKLGICASTDNHESEPGSVHDADISHPRFPCNGGITGVLADDNIVAADGLREAIWEAIRSRRVYGTSGPKIDVDLIIGDGLQQWMMGSEMEIAAGTHLVLETNALSSDENGAEYLSEPVNITRIDLITNEDGVLKETLIATPNSDSCTVTQNIIPESNCFYYVRITQVDNEGIVDKAWSSPIWVTTLREADSAAATSSSPDAEK